MKITIEIDSKKEMEKLSALFETFKISAVNVVAANERIVPVVKGDKTIDPKALFGIWEKAPRSLEDIRKAAWERKS